MVSDAARTKRDDLLETAHRLFLRYGIRRISVSEICREAGVSKMTFYKYFDNKADLARSFYLNEYARGLSEYQQIMAQDIPFSRKVEQLIQQKLRNTEGISQDFVRDVYQDDRLGLRELMEHKQQEYQQIILQDFKKAAEKGEIRAGIHPQFITYFMKKIGDMAADQYLLSLYKNEQELIMELTRFFFYGLGVKDEH